MVDDSRERKAHDSESKIPSKRAKTHSEDAAPTSNMEDTSGTIAAGHSSPNVPTQDEGEVQNRVQESDKKKGKRRANEAELADIAPKAKYRKLAPPRPLPTVPTSVSATGPRSAHVEGKNYICITRKTPLAMYLRRCKDVVLNDGHKTLHLSAMGAAIPHMLNLALSLPEILPYSPEEIQTEVLTGTVELQDEIIPDDEDEDISIRTRGKSTLSIVIKIGDGIDEGLRTGKGRRKQPSTGEGKASRSTGPRQPQRKNAPGKHQQAAGPSRPDTIVVREEDMDEH